MAKTIGIIQVKGGAGRSTVATNLAGELSKSGLTVLIDCDMPQGTSASWFAMRQQNDPQTTDRLITDTAADHRELITKVEQYEAADYIVLDCPPRIAELTRAALVLADLCLIPVGASKAEIWATTDILALVDEARQIRRVKARTIWTRHRPHTKLAQELTDLAARELGIKALESSLGLRVAYMQALGEGQTAAETPDRNAKAEVMGLADEVKTLLE